MKGVRFEILNSYGKHLYTIFVDLIDETWLDNLVDANAIA